MSSVQITFDLDIYQNKQQQFFNITAAWGSDNSWANKKLRNLKGKLGEGDSHSGHQEALTYSWESKRLCICMHAQGYAHAQDRLENTLNSYLWQALKSRYKEKVKPKAAL